MIKSFFPFTNRLNRPYKTLNFSLFFPKKVQEKDVLDVFKGSVGLPSHHAPPNIMSHFTAREKCSKLSEKRYLPPANQEGMTLSAVVGYGGDGRKNLVWHPATGKTIFDVVKSELNET